MAVGCFVRLASELDLTFLNNVFWIKINSNEKTITFSLPGFDFDFIHLF